jgi:hypothetical protein
MENKQNQDKIKLIENGQQKEITKSELEELKKDKTKKIVQKSENTFLVKKLIKG